MAKIYSGAFFLCPEFFCPEAIWQKDIKSVTQDFISQVSTTTGQQYLTTESGIHSWKGSMKSFEADIVLYDRGWKTAAELKNKE